jgi:hypothetical protein
MDEICIFSLKNDYFRHFYMENAYGQSDASKAGLLMTGLGRALRPAEPKWLVTLTFIE